jgi:hypothetical protein
MPLKPWSRRHIMWEMLESAWQDDVRACPRRVAMSTQPSSQLVQDARSLRSMLLSVDGAVAQEGIHLGQPVANHRCLVRQTLDPSPVMTSPERAHTGDDATDRSRYREDHGNGFKGRRKVLPLERRVVLGQNPVLLQLLRECTGIWRGADVGQSQSGVHLRSQSDATHRVLRVNEPAARYP